MAEAEKQSVTITYWARVGMYSTAPLNASPLAAIGLVSPNNQNPAQPQQGASGEQRVLAAIYQYQVETEFPPATPGFEETVISMREIINDGGGKAPKGEDHMKTADVVFLTMVEEYGKERMVKVSGGGTGLSNGDTRGFVAEHDPALVYLNAGG